ncbi:MAG: branched-chain amino acid transaminase [Calditrichaeota bacterium]|nr:branched-chain amino acid transaminase [Calditrichota bacterium]
MDPRDEKGKIWLNGSFVDWPDAKIHVMSHVIHYGTSFFEGIRCYKTQKGPAIFRLPEHVRRLFDSAKIYRTEIPFSQQDVFQACIDVVKKNNLESAYIRPVVYRGYGSLGVDPSKCPIEIAIGALNWGRYLGEEAINSGVDVKISSWLRMHPNTFPAMAKAGGNYLNSQLIKLEALNDGYSEGIALNSNGLISEGSGENLFVVRDGKIYTPTIGNSILPGITRDSIIRIARDFGYKIIETEIPREMLYIADELFFTGTAAEVTPIRSVDKISIGAGTRGPVTKKIQQRFFEILETGDDGKYGWLTFVK